MNTKAEDRSQGRETKHGWSNDHGWSFASEMKSKLFQSLEWSSQHKRVSNETKYCHISPQKQILRAEMGAPQCPSGTKCNGKGERKGSRGPMGK